MKKIISLYKKYEEIINYIFVGGLTTIISIASYFLLAKIFNIDYMISTILSWILSVSFAYSMNKIIVFKSKNKNILKEFIMFVYCRVLSLLIEMVSMFIMVSLIKIDDGFAKVVVQFIVLVLNYIFSKIIVFKKTV